MHVERNQPCLIGHKAATVRAMRESSGHQSHKRLNQKLLGLDVTVMLRGQ
jgi:hypothetical protein